MSSKGVTFSVISEGLKTSMLKEDPKRFVIETNKPSQETVN